MPENVRPLLRIAFAGCLLGVLYLALTPVPFIENRGADKINHVLAFLALGVLIRLGWPQHRALLAMTGLLVLGMAIEVIQHFVGRDASWGDLLADASGLLLAMVVVSVFRMWSSIAAD